MTPSVESSTSDVGEVEVTHADRALFRDLLGWDVTDDIATITGGKFDKHRKMQMIARHRLASSPPAVPVNVEAGEREAINRVVRQFRFTARGTGERKLCIPLKDTERLADTILAALSTPATPDAAASDGEVERLRKAVKLAAGQFAAIREANDADDADSYRSDDREGCLEWTYAAAQEAEKAMFAALSQEKA